MSELKVNKISPATGTDFTLGDSGDVFTVPSGATITNSGTATGFGGGGKILQVQQAYKQDTFASNSATEILVTGLSVNITPTATTSKILVFASVTGSQDYGSNNSYFTIRRDSTTIGQGDASGTIERCSFQLNVTNAAFTNHGGVIFLDPNTPSDTTTAITYKVMGRSENGSVYWWVNRSDQDANNTNARSSSSITVMEVGA